MQTNDILEFQGAYRFLSNFWPCDICYDGLFYPSSEAAFQAAKCANDEDKIQFTKLKAYEAKRLGNLVPKRADWDDVRISVMEEILRIKFQRGSQLRTLLDATGNALLVEGNVWKDTFWGVCRGVGFNHLGILLMKIRDGDE